MTVEAWARDYVLTTSLAEKFDASQIPSDFAENHAPTRLTAPGRPAALRVVDRAPRSPGPEAIRAPAKRAQVLHTFLHHELQAAELCAWALLAFADAPLPFRRGLLRVAKDEIRHMNLYRARIEALGSAVGDFPVRDWFWLRVPTSKTAAHFVATLGVGFEGANLDHAARFAQRFRAIGDEDAARLQELVAAEEVPHVAFAAAWFERLAGPLAFDAWRAHLVEPLSPALMRGDPLDRVGRRASGLSEAFLSELATWTPGS